ncbi:hypothetical protein HHK36_016225 [Tetracentron sinense]|uniref:PH domain-containing protein n=1 Tax=Tetracentron sinense TaxID=13715 RepID=A0A834Z5C8_TETSI|nr:hypothetical protein HHK36_016225 [Tetracentron sinense]
MEADVRRGLMFQPAVESLRGKIAIVDAPTLFYEGIVEPDSPDPLSSLHIQLFGKLLPPSIPIKATRDPLSFSALIDVRPGAERSRVMDSLWRAATGATQKADDYDGVEFWSNPERTGWLTKQGEYIKTWRRRWFVLKQGKLFWFKDSSVIRASKPRGVIRVATCLTVKGAEDVINKHFAFELSTNRETMYFVADSEKEKEEWINSIGRSIVQQSRSVSDSEVVDYDSKR